MGYREFDGDSEGAKPAQSAEELREQRRRDLLEARQQRRLAHIEHEGGESSEINRTREKIAHNRLKSAREIRRKLKKLLGSK